jgi:flagellar biogenesis protein FliO
MKENKSVDATSDLLDFLCDEENQEELRRMRGESEIVVLLSKVIFVLLLIIGLIFLVY